MKTLKQIQSEIAKKHKLGNSLVTGHKATYFDEAALAYAEQIIDKCAEVAETIETGYFSEDVYLSTSYVNKDTILAVKKLLK